MNISFFDSGAKRQHNFYRRAYLAENDICERTDSLRSFKPPENEGQAAAEFR